jgi:uncharacterized membrane protein
VIVAIAWIGSSFYFVFLDNSLLKPQDPALKAKGVDGELWAVHGGGFYNPQKYLVAPKIAARAPALVLLGKLQHLADRLCAVHGDVPVQRQQLPGRQERARLVAAGRRASRRWPSWWCSGWSTTGSAAGSARKNGQVGGDAIVGALVLVYVVAASWLACQLFAGRAAFLMVGAMMATAMSANVFFWIIPGQKKVIAQMKAGQPVDPIHGQRAKQRSVHNTYFTLPVLIAMLSNHYGWLYQGRHNWLVLVLLMLAGALIRHSFVVRHKALAKRPPGALGIRRGRHGAVLLGLAVWLAPAPQPAASATAGPRWPRSGRGRPALHAVPQRRRAAEERGAAHARTDPPARAGVYQQVVVLKAMPLNNATQITDAERALIKRWFEAGAPAPAPPLHVEPFRMPGYGSVHKEAPCPPSELSFSPAARWNKSAPWPPR